MAKASIPVYDICSIDRRSRKDLLIEPFGAYLEKHYAHLHRPHRHSFYHLVLFTGGSGTHTIDFEQFPVEPGQIYFMIPGQVHSWHFEEGVNGYIVHFGESLFASFLQDGNYLERFPFFSGKTEDGVCHLPPAVQAEAECLFRVLLSEINGETEGHGDMIRLKLLELFILVSRSCPHGKETGMQPKNGALLRNFRQLIERHFRTVRLPKEYAGLLYVTPNHLNAVCMEGLGKTAGDLIRERVLLEAKRLLTHDDKKVAQIAGALQFGDNSYFNRFFRKYTGQTPEQFRKSIHA